MWYIYHTVHRHPYAYTLVALQLKPGTRTVMHVNGTTVHTQFRSDSSAVRCSVYSATPNTLQCTAR